MASKHKILIVDDEQLNREMLKEILDDDDYELICVENGAQCLEMLPKFQPDLILLDVNMPSMGGYQVCEEIKSSAETKDISIIFVSALDTLAERLAGYEVGGDDYITRPFESRELVKRVKMILNNRDQQKSLQGNIDAAMSTAMTALTSTSELGVVLNYLRASFSCNDYESLALLTTESLMSIGLRSAVQIRVDGDTHNFNSDGSINPLEATVMSRVYNEKRIMDINNKTIFSFEHISVLAKSMPVDDPGKNGRYKDNLALLTEGAEDRIKAILIQSDLEKKQNGLVSMVDNTREALSKVNEKHEEHKIKSMKILANLIQNVEASFTTLGLLEDQESAFLSIINNAVSETLELYNEGIELDASMADIVNGLQDLMYNSAA